MIFAFVVDKDRHWYNETYEEIDMFLNAEIARRFLHNLQWHPLEPRGNTDIQNLYDPL